MRQRIASGAVAPVVALALSALAANAGAQVEPPAEEAYEALLGVTFVDDREGWAVGRDSVVLHTADGGETWQLQHRALGPEGEERILLAVAFADARTGIAVGQRGLILTTGDGGAHWARGARIRSPRRGPIEAALAEATTALAAAREDHERRCGDGAASPEADAGAEEPALPAPPDPYCEELRLQLSLAAARADRLERDLLEEPEWYDERALGEEAITGVQFAAARTAFAWGDGFLLVTRDAGATWTPVLLPGSVASVRGAWFLDERRGWIVGPGGYVGRTDDGGRSFRDVSTPERWGLTAVCFRDERVGWAGGEAGVLYRTNDGGRRWKRLDTGSHELIRGLAWLDEQVGFLTTWERVLWTRDGGASWAPLEVPPVGGRRAAAADQLPRPIAVAVVGATTAIAVGTWGLAYRTDDGAMTWRVLRSENEARRRRVEAERPLAKARLGLDVEFGFVHPAGEIYERFGPGGVIGLQVLALRGRLKIGGGYRMFLTQFRERIVAPAGALEDDRAVRLDGRGFAFELPVLAQLQLVERGRFYLHLLAGVSFVWHGFMIVQAQEEELASSDAYDRDRIGVGATEALELLWVVWTPTTAALGGGRQLSRWAVFVRLGLDESWSWNVDRVQKDLGRKDTRSFGTELWPFVSTGFAIYQ